MVLFHWIIQGLLTFFIVSISLNLNKQIPLIQLDLLHNLKETFLIRDTFNFHVLNFPFLCSYIPAAAADGVYVSQLKWCSASWASHIWILLFFIESVSQMNTDMFGCTDCRSFHLYLLMTCHHVWHITGCWHQHHDECHSLNRTLFTILSFCV